MLDQDKSKQELIDELAEMRQRVAALETAETDRKQAEEALRENEERFRKVFEEGPLGILLVGTDGSIQHANPHFCDMLGYSENAIIALGLAGITHPDDWERDHRFVSRLWRGEISHYHSEKRYFRKDGQVVWRELTVSLMHDEAGRPINTVGMVKNITKRKQAEKALQESERLLRTLIDASPEAISLMNTEGTILLVNQTVSHRFGRPVDAILGKTPRDLLPASVANERMRRLHEVVCTGKATRFEDQLFERHVENAVYPVLDAQGVVVAVAVLSIDRTEQKRAEEALQKAHDELEQRVRERTAELAKANEELAIFRKFADASGQGFSMADLDGHLVYLNPALCRMLGEESPDNVLGKHLSICYSEESNRQGKQEIEPVLMRDGHWEGELPMLSRQGKAIPTWHHTFVIRDELGSPLRLAVVITDITERKQAEEALRASEERFRVAFEEAPVGMVIGEGDGVLTKVNRAVCRMTGNSEQELVGRHVRDLTYPEDRELSGPFVKRLLAGEIASFTLEKRYLRKDGQPFWAQATTAAVHGPDGRIVLALGVVEDITERKQAQEALRREYRNLKHLLHASDHERQLIAYEIHDGLAQQLAAALMQLQAFDHLKDKTPKEAAKAYDAAMTMLQQGHFEVRRLIAGVRPPILDEGGVAEAISHLIHEQSRLKGPAIDYHSRVDFDRLDPTLENAIYRIAQEALANACKYSKSKRISASLLQRGERLRIEIRDWGVGFNPKAVPKNHFGLEGIRQRARLLGGKCSIRSTEGKGTRVTVELPVVLRDDEE